MSTNKTSNYQLNQWVKSDPVLMEEFNADNAKIDSALATLAVRINGKASTTAMDSLSSLVAQHTAALDTKGNCILHTSSYTGNGLYGANSPRTLTFPGKPLAVLINGDGGFAVMLQGVGATVAAFNVSYPLSVSWSGNSVSWYHDGSARADGMLNRSGYTYQVAVLMKAD